MALQCWAAISGLILLSGSAFGAISGKDRQTGPMAGGELIIAANAHLTTPVGGLDRTDAQASTVDVEGHGFVKALRVVVRKNAEESNATQLTMLIERPVKQGDVMLGEFWIRGAAANGRSPAGIGFLFERTVDPWTKSVSQNAFGATDPSVWRHIIVPFQSAESYAVGGAMVSLRFAIQPQTVEIGGLRVVDYGNSRSLDDLIDYATAQSPLGKVRVDVDFSSQRQTMMGFGGDFCQPRYGYSEAMDVVGQYTLDHLHVVHARVGFPLNNWTPQPGEYRDDAQAHAALLALQEMSRRHIPTVLTVWEGPQWMLGGQPEQMGRILAPAKYVQCIDAIVRYLVLARDKYNASVDYFSFNEPDYGVNFRFTSKTIGDFIRQAGPKFTQAGLKTKFIVGDTTGGAPYSAYATPLLTDESIAPYLGPLGFHCWDGLGASEDSYRSIADLGSKFHKPIWCLEAGWDSGLWQAPNPWGTWNNALQTAMVYARTINLTGASLMDYWTYQDNYPIVDKAGPKPYPVFNAIQQMEPICKKGAKVVVTRSSDSDVQALVTVGPGRGRFSGLIVNPKGPGTMILSGLPHNARVEVRLSDKNIQQRLLPPLKVGNDGRLSLSVGSRTILTFIGNSAS
ncbi:MAG: hypothetical protein P4L46_12010 [Fimbriimonas sp.]|nr:hypothetical protein [Fimbriimonas sp.]